MLKLQQTTSALLSQRVNLTQPQILGSRNLNFNMQRQKQIQWCWAAVATSSSLFYNPGSGWTQCLLVNTEFSRASCCQNGATNQCNRTHFLDRALITTGNLNNVVAGRITYEAIKQEINAGRPVAAYIDVGIGHFAVIDGYNDAGQQMLSIKDSFYTGGSYPYEVFSANYQGGRWTFTYFTKP